MKRKKKQIKVEHAADMYYRVLAEGKTEIIKKCIEDMKVLEKESPEEFKQLLRSLVKATLCILKDNKKLQEEAVKHRKQKIIKRAFKNRTIELAEKLDKKRLKQ